MASSYLDSDFISPSTTDAPEWQNRGISPAPTVMTRGGTPAPILAPKTPFMSRLFGKKKVKPALQRTSTMQTVLQLDHEATSPGPSGTATPAPSLRCTTSPFNDLTHAQQGFERERPLPQLPPAWTTFSPVPQDEIQALRQGAHTSLSMHTTATISKKPKKKRSFSALASFFKAGATTSQSTETSNPPAEKRRARRGTLKSTFSTTKHVKVSSRSSSFGTLHVPDRSLSDVNYSARKRASTVMSLPPQSPSLAMLFDASHADAGNAFDDHVHSPTVTYAPMRKLPAVSPIPGGRREDQVQVGSTSQHTPTLPKSRSTPDLTIQVKKSAIVPSPTFPPSPYARSPLRPIGATGSRASTILRPRSPSLKQGISTSPVVPKSPMSIKMPSGLPGLSSPHGRAPLATAKERSYSPAPSMYAMSTLSKKANKTFLDQILDLDLGDMTIPTDLDPWAFKPDDNDHDDDEQEEGKIEGSPQKVIAGLTVKVTKELRPDTAGTFGRPYTANRPATGNRPNTGVSRPDTGATDRPDTGMSAFLGANAASNKHRPAPLKFDGRMRRISKFSASEEADEEHQEDEDVASGSSSAPPSSSQLSFALDNLNTSLITQTQLKDDSGFNDTSDPKFLTLSAIGEGPRRPLSTATALPNAVNKGARQTDFRPTTADTTHLPLDLPDLDIAFDPRASLGSLGRQSSVSTLSDFEQKTQATQHTGLSPHSPKAYQRLSMPNHVTSNEDADVTPKKHVSTMISSWRRKKSLVGNSSSTGETAQSSVSPSVMSRILSRKHLEESMFATKGQLKTTTSREIGVQTEPPTPAIVMTFADAEVPLYSPRSGRSSGASRLSSELAAAETARINDPHDPFGESYFPPVHTLFPSSPFPPSSATSATPVNSVRGSQIDNVDIVSRLLEQLEKETMRREALEYSLASMRESTGADLRRSDQRIKDLMEENKMLASRLAKPVSI